MSATHSMAATAQMAVPFVRLDRDDPELLEELLAEVRTVAENAAFTLGSYVEDFEADFATYCEADEAVGLASGTDALAMSLRALGIGAGHEVIVPANTFIATAEAVSIAGATPRFVDVDPTTGLITAEIVERAITPKVKAVMPVHLYGATVDMDPLLEVARAAKIAVIEDACQAHGARYRGRRVGALGDIGCFSFYPAKNLGAAGEAGLVVTSDAAAAKRMKALRHHAQSERYIHTEIGFNYRMEGLQSLVLSHKLKLLPDWIEERRGLAKAYGEQLAGLPLALPRVAHQDHVFHLYVVRTPRRDELRGFLQERGIETGLHYPVPLHRQPCFATLGFDPKDFPVCERYTAELLSLPNGAAALELSPQRKREMLFEALLRQLEAVSREQPTLMVFEDAHWIDPTSRELLDIIVERVSRLPIMLIIF